MSRDFDAIDVLRSLVPSSSTPPGSIAALRQLYEAVGPGMPDDLVATKTKDGIAQGAEAYLYNYDEGHAGRLSIPGIDTGGSIDYTFTMDRPHPERFIGRHLTFRDKVAASTGYNKDDEPELVFFVPGLNTFHQPHPDETSTVQRLRNYVNVLLTIPMSQIHIGTSMDQGDVSIDASRAPALRALIDGLRPVLPDGLEPRDEGTTLVWDSRQIDRLQTALSQYNIIKTPVKTDIIALLETTRNEETYPFVLAVYSRGAIECEAALRQHVEDSLKSGEHNRAMEKRLRHKVTVLTIGNCTDNWPDGPAYIHLSAWTDPVTSKSGVTAKNPKGAGRGAIFLNCDSPYYEQAFDNHNFGAVTSQYLSLVLAASKAKGIRDLWERAHKDKMVIPDDPANTLKAMIQLTRGWEWLWSAEQAWTERPFAALPTTGGAAAILREKMGDEFVARVVANFGTN